MPEPPITVGRCPNGDDGREERRLLAETPNYGVDTLAEETLSMVHLTCDEEYQCAWLYVTHRVFRFSTVVDFACFATSRKTLCALAFRRDLHRVAKSATAANLDNFR